MTKEQQNVIDSYFLSLHAKLLGLAFGTLYDQYKAEEAVQQTFLIACRKPDAFLNSPNPSGWLTNTLKNVIANMYRCDNSDRRLLAKATALYQNETVYIEDLLAVDTIWSDIVKTPEFQFLKLFIYDDLSHTEVAQIYGISYIACRKKKSKARKKLRKLVLENL